MIINLIDDRGGVLPVEYDTMPISVRTEVEAVIERAAKDEIYLGPCDFQVMDGDVYIQSMDPIEWLNAIVGRDEE